MMTTSWAKDPAFCILKWLIMTTSCSWSKILYSKRLIITTRCRRSQQLAVKLGLGHSAIWGSVLQASTRTTSLWCRLTWCSVKVDYRAHIRPMLHVWWPSDSTTKSSVMILSFECPAGNPYIPWTHSFYGCMLWYDVTTSLGWGQVCAISYIAVNI